MDYKRQNYRTEKTSEADKAGMNDLLARVKEIRTQATKAQPESGEESKNLAGVAYTQAGVL